MLALPIKWIPVKLQFLEPEECIYGLNFDTEQITCGFYLTNFEQIWSCELTSKELFEKARELGLEGLNDNRLIDLFKTIDENIPQKLDFELEADQSITASVDFGLKWSFKLVVNDPQQSINFLTKLNFQNFANLSHLQYQNEKLKENLGVKDAYIRFLELNFKHSHGDDAMVKYKKNNNAVVNSIEKFDPVEWERRVNKEYAKERSKLPNKKNWRLDVENSIFFNGIFANQNYSSVAKSLFSKSNTTQAITSKKRKNSIDVPTSMQSKSNTSAITHNDGTITNNSDSPKPKRKKLGQL
ncbi:hypothetical protein KGF54_005464 [Candida jiufengensis]|uniref:uncharacterized protein n=1 Tax=Candida jiufengensis TaxID=497108 RepID=UPI00222522C7|nr:uncharacterized protein KGF54_005464 [Candida jiufengensis]KAI5949587.1 hypothetical protein KGF54_005464 [Candida jiufengensis]